jgi:hypothetical protein
MLPRRSQDVQLLRGVGHQPRRGRGSAETVSSISRSRSVKDEPSSHTSTEPTRGLEPLTARLQVGCATNCATSAVPGNKSRNKDRDNAGTTRRAAGEGPMRRCGRSFRRSGSSDRQPRSRSGAVASNVGQPASYVASQRTVLGRGRLHMTRRTTRRRPLTHSRCVAVPERLSVAFLIGREDVPRLRQ